MYGSGLLKGLAITMRHFIETYMEDIRWASRGGRYYNDEALQVRQSLKGQKSLLSPLHKAQRTYSGLLSEAPQFQ